MKTRTCMRRFAQVGGTAAAMGVPAMSVAQPGASSSATETALIFTGVLTLVMIAFAFLVLIIPEEDRLRFVESARRIRRLFVSGANGRVTLLDHDFDGIQELDNRIPPWFTTLFSVTVLFGAVYLLDYHVLHSSKLSGEEYADEVAAADLQRRIVLASEGSIDEATLAPLKDPTAIAHGQELFSKNCVSCHGPLGGGGVGPNLTDDYWIHGGGIRSIYTTIKNGWPAKGMISWQLVFTPKQIQEIASYVLTLRGTHPAGEKAAQGDLYIEKDTSTVVQAPAKGPTK